MNSILLIAFFIIVAIFFYKVLGNKKDKYKVSKGYQGGEQKVNNDSDVK